MWAIWDIWDGWESFFYYLWMWVIISIFLTGIFYSINVYFGIENCRSRSIFGMRNFDGRIKWKYKICFMVFWINYLGFLLLKEGQNREEGYIIFCFWIYFLILWDLNIYFFMADIDIPFYLIPTQVSNIIIYEEFPWRISFIA